MNDINLSSSGASIGADAAEITPAQRVRLLTRVAEFYHRCFLDTSVAIEFLKNLGLRDTALCQTFQLGLANGSLLEVLPDAGETVSQLTTLGVLLPDGAERFAEHIVFPMWSADGAIIGLTGIRMSDGAVMRLPGPSLGTWNGAACQRSADVLVVPSLMDALLAIDAG